MTKDPLPGSGKYGPLSLKECMHDSQSHALTTHFYQLIKLGIVEATTARETAKVTDKTYTNIHAK